MAREQAERYALDPAFERAVVTMAACRPAFYGRVGHAIEDEKLTQPAARLSMRATHAISKDSGKGPDSTVLVMQRLRRWMRDGRVTQAEIADVCALYDAADDLGLPDEDSVVEELVPLLRRDKHMEALRTMHDEFANKGDLENGSRLIAEANRIGVYDVTLGITLGDPAFQAIARLNRIERLPTGVFELDQELEGGLPRGELGIYTADTGGGKSMALNHTAAHSLASGLFTGIATMELSEARAAARLKAALLDIEVNVLLRGDHAAARVRYQAIADKLGVCVVKYFTPGTTTVQDIERWMKACEAQMRAPMEVLIVDYADKMTAKGAHRGDDSQYTAMLAVYEGLRILAEQRDGWCWTASQPRRSTTGRKLIGTDDLSDSQHKARVTDLLVSLNRREEQGEVQLEWLVAKFRDGRAGGRVGPLPQDWAYGRATQDKPFDFEDLP